MVDGVFNFVSGRGGRQRTCCGGGRRQPGQQLTEGLTGLVVEVEIAGRCADALKIFKDFGPRYWAAGRHRRRRWVFWVHRSICQHLLHARLLVGVERLAKLVALHGCTNSTGPATRLPNLWLRWMTCILNMVEVVEGGMETGVAGRLRRTSTSWLISWASRLPLHVSWRTGMLCKRRKSCVQGRAQSGKVTFGCVPVLDVCELVGEVVADPLNSCTRLL